MKKLITLVQKASNFSKKLVTYQVLGFCSIALREWMGASKEVNTTPFHTRLVRGTSFPRLEGPHMPKKKSAHGW